MITFFNCGYNNHLSMVQVVDDDDFTIQVGWWLSGRIFGRYISVRIPWKKRR